MARPVRDEVLAALAAHRPLLDSHHVRSISVFGSVARDEAAEDSDEVVVGGKQDSVVLVRCLEDCVVRYARVHLGDLLELGVRRVEGKSTIS